MGTIRVSCPNCKGIGIIMVPKYDRLTKKRTRVAEPCKRCHGSGQITR